MLAEKLMHSAEAAFGVEGGVFEVVDIDAEVGGDVVADHFQPVLLFGGEAGCYLPFDGLRANGGLLLRQPGLEVGGDALGVGHEFVFLVHGETHQADEVGEDTRRAATADF